MGDLKVRSDLDSRLPIKAKFLNLRLEQKDECGISIICRSGPPSVDAATRTLDRLLSLVPNVERTEGPLVKGDAVRWKVRRVTGE